MLILGGVSFALLIAAGLGAWDMANRAVEAERWIVHTMDVRRSARALLVQLLDAETGERGFVLSEDEGFLEPFNRAMRSVAPAIGDMSKVTSDDREQQERVRNLVPKVEAMMDKLRHTVALVRQGQRVEATAIIKSGVGRFCCRIGGSAEIEEAREGSQSLSFAVRP